MKTVIKKWSPIVFVLLACGIMIFCSTMIYENNYLPDRLNRNVQYYKAEVIEIVEDLIEPDSYTGEFEVGVQNIKVEIKGGPYKGEQYEFKNYVSRLYNIVLQEKNNIVVAAFIEDGQISELNVNSYYRSDVLLVLALIFFALVAWVGKFKGVKSVVSLLFTGTCIVCLMIPMMLRGAEPIAAALLVVVLSTTVTLGLVSGRSKKTVNAIIGTLAGVIIATVVAYLFGHLANLSGGTMQDTESLLYVSETSGLKVKGLLFASILIASLGAVMDVAMSIASAMYEFITVNPNLSKKELIRSGMNVGTDMIGTMTNTLVLALAGGSLNGFILIFVASMDTTHMLNLDVLGVEIIQGLAGSIGIVMTVPVSVLVGCMLYKK
ncbi:MAG TPA: YibE/F family protein [Firmicutes bacterium]|nr:YibE/F family protein [Bacillota bacterium]